MYLHDGDHDHSHGDDSGSSDEGKACSMCTHVHGKEDGTCDCGCDKK